MARWDDDDDTSFKLVGEDGQLAEIPVPVQAPCVHDYGTPPGGNCRTCGNRRPES